MDNAQKAIMIGVGLFITIIIIAAVMLITGMGQNLLNKGQAQVSGISESLMNDLVAQYDGKTMSGAQVRTAAVQLVNRDDATITVVIAESGTTTGGTTTGGTTTGGTTTGGTTTGGTTSYTKATSNVTNSINAKIKALGTTSQFVGSVSNSGGAVTVTFTKK